ncbi:MAG: KH domain-containing protein [Candidatus Woesearchaeota archaeon]
MEKYLNEIRVPKERVAVVIGKKGETKEKIEKELNCKLRIDSETGLVTINSKDAIMLYKASEIIKAIARGFSPENAFLLLKTDYVLEIISLKEYIKSSNRMKIVLGRIIGSNGKSKRTIEELTNTVISVYGKTVSIIGETLNVINARRAVTMLINGAQHTRVFSFLSKIAEEEKKISMLGYEEREDVVYKKIDEQLNKNKKENKKERKTTENNKNKNKKLETKE